MNYVMKWYIVLQQKSHRHKTSNFLRNSYKSMVKLVAKSGYYEV
jgi:hypothetical protein